jgi:hypothetical protein
VEAAVNKGSAVSHNFTGSPQGVAAHRFFLLGGRFVDRELSPFVFAQRVFEHT